MNKQLSLRKDGWEERNDALREGGALLGLSLPQCLSKSIPGWVSVFQTNGRPPATSGWWTRECFVQWPGITDSQPTRWRLSCLHSQGIWGA